MKPEHTYERSGKIIALYSGLLNMAHERGIKEIDTELIQVPNEENGMVAVVKATVEMIDDTRFSGIGDANPKNVGRNIAPHIIRMAETRAKARALRDALDAGNLMLEDEVEDEANVAPRVPIRDTSQSQDEVSDAFEEAMREALLEDLANRSRDLGFNDVQIQKGIQRWSKQPTEDLKDALKRMEEHLEQQAGTKK